MMAKDLTFETIKILNKTIDQLEYVWDQIYALCGDEREEVILIHEQIDQTIISLAEFENKLNECDDL